MKRATIAKGSIIICVVLFALLYIYVSNRPREMRKLNISVADSVELMCDDDEIARIYIYGLSDVIKACTKEGQKNGNAIIVSEGEIRSRGKYLKDKFSGRWIWNEKEGIALIETTFDDGIREGEYLERDQTGSIIAQGNYQGGYKNGEWTMKKPGDGTTKVEYHGGVLKSEYDKMIKDICYHETSIKGPTSRGIVNGEELVDYSCRDLIVSFDQTGTMAHTTKTSPP